MYFYLSILNELLYSFQ